MGRLDETRQQTTNRSEGNKKQLTQIQMLTVEIIPVHPKLTVSDSWQYQQVESKEGVQVLEFNGAVEITWKIVRGQQNCVCSEGNGETSTSKNQVGIQILCALQICSGE